MVHRHAGAFARIAALRRALGAALVGCRWLRRLRWLYASRCGSTLAWKYRDYVTRAFNSDKPFDRFVTEQLAGDELAGPIQGDWTAEQIELLTATDFCGRLPMARAVVTTVPRLATKSLPIHSRSSAIHSWVRVFTAHNAMIIVTIRSRMSTITRFVRCSNQLWIGSSGAHPSQRLVSLYTAADRQKAAEIEAAAQEMTKQRDMKRDEFMQQALDKELEKYTDPLREQLRTAYKTPEKDRTDEHKGTAQEETKCQYHARRALSVFPKAAEELKKLDEQIAAKRAEKPPEEIRARVDRTERSSTIGQIISSRRSSTTATRDCTCTTDGGGTRRATNRVS